MVHCLEKSGVKTIAELRQWPEKRLLALRSFGEASLENVRWFMRWTQQLESGAASISDFAALLKEFLNQQEIFVIEQRYGLTDPLFRPQMKRRTLQEIADASIQVTRERIRQVEEAALLKLRSQLCRAMAESLMSRWVARLQKTACIVAASDLAPWAGDSSLGGYQPWGALLLTSETIERIRFRYDCFTSLPVQTLDRVERKITQLLREAHEPVPLEHLLNAVAGELPMPGADRRQFMTTLLNHHPQISGATGSRYFLTQVGAPQVIAAILRERREPLHYHALTRIYNAQMLPHSRRGTGYILRVVSTSPGLRRRERGLYEVKVR